MWLTRTAVHRPVSTLMASIAVVLLGLMALQKLSIDLMPEMTYPTVSVTALYDGAGPAEVETLITRPLEQALSSVGKVERLSSSSNEGASTIRVQLQWGTDIDAATAEMRQAIQKLRQQERLPDDVDEPFIRQYDVADSPIMYLAVGSELESIPLTQLTEQQIVPQLERLDGVAQVRLRGQTRREIHVDLDRGKLEALDMGVNEVVEALRRENVDQPAGDLERGNLKVLIRTEGAFRNLDEIADVIVRQRAGAVVRIRDIAVVSDAAEERTELTRINGQAGLMVYIYRQAGANTIDVSDRVHEAVERINRQLKRATLAIRVDKADFIRQSIENVRTAAVYGMSLAVIVLVLFLRSFRSTIVIAISMPLSVLATFVLIYFNNYTLNMVSFGGLALGIGLLVDNSIVVIESIFRKQEAGFDPCAAAIEGTTEVASAIVASTITTLIVFLPLLFVEGVTGIMLHQLAAVVSFSLLCSLLASLTLTPVLTAHWILRPAAVPQTRGGKLIAWLVNGFHRFNQSILRGVEFAYSEVLRICLKQRGAVLSVLLLCVSCTAGLYPRIGSEFLPKADEGEMSIEARMAAGIRLESLDRQAQFIESIVLEHVPEARTTAAFIGDGKDDADDWNRTTFRLQLSPSSERERGVEDVRRDLAERIGSLPGTRIRVQASSSSMMARMLRRSGGGGDIELEVRGFDLDTADALAEELVARIKDIPGLVNLEIHREEKRPELAARIDRSKASLLGVSVSDVTQALETTIRGTGATVYREGGDEFTVLVRLREQDRTRFADLEQVGLTTPAGQVVPLLTLVSFEDGQAPVSINRLDQQRILEISGDVEDRSLGEVVREIQQRLDQTDIPPGFNVQIAGEWEEQQQSFEALTQGFILAILLMYMVMASQFESLKDPLVIIASIPLGGIGVILVLVLTDTTLNVQSFIGLVMLAGIVVNNAIVLVDYINHLRATQPTLPLTELLLTAGRRRFRPIIMTTLTTVLAMLPIAWGGGEGGELQAPMARVVVGGLITSTLTTLIAIPLLVQLTSKRERI